MDAVASGAAVGVDGSGRERAVGDGYRVDKAAVGPTVREGRAGSQCGQRGGECQGDSETFHTKSPFRPGLQYVQTCTRSFARSATYTRPDRSTATALGYDSGSVPLSPKPYRYVGWSATVKTTTRLPRASATNSLPLATVRPRGSARASGPPWPMAVTPRGLIARTRAALPSLTYTRPSSSATACTGYVRPPGNPVLLPKRPTSVPSVVMTSTSCSSWPMSVTYTRPSGPKDTPLGNQPCRLSTTGGRNVPVHSSDGLYISTAARNRSATYRLPCASSDISPGVRVPGWLSAGASPAAGRPSRANTLMSRWPPPSAT